MFFGDYQIKNLHMLGHVVTENPSIFLENFVGTFNGSELYGSASLTNLYSNPHINAALDAHQIPIDRLPKIWPQNLAKSARTWVVENISGGTLEDITAYVDFSLSDLQKDNLERNQIFGQFRVRDTRVAYIKDLPTANNLFADGWFDGIDLHIGIEMGTILDQRIDGTTVEFLNVYTGEEIGLLGLRSTGPLSNLAAFPGFSASVIPWFEDGKTQGLAGSTSADLRINFPLISSLMVQDLTITGKVSVQHLAFQRNENMLGATKLSLSRGNGIIFFEDAKVSGNATAIVNKTPVEIEWATAPNSRPADLIGRAIIRTTVTDNSLIPLENLFRFATGKAGIEITINSLANGYQNAFVNIDASHLAASFPSIKFEKKLGETVHIISNLDLEGWKVFSPMTFHIRGENIKGAAIIELNADNEIAKLSLKDVSYDNERITADISFNNDIYEMNAHTKSLDVGSLQALEATSEQKIRKVRLLVDNLTAGKMTTFSNTKIQYDTLAEGSLEIKVESKDANLSQSLLNLLDDIQSTETLSDNRSFHMSGKIGTLYSSTGDILRRVQTEISAQDGQLVRTRIEGHFNEQEKVRVEMTGSGTERKIIIASENAGEFLHLLGVTSNLVGGKLYLEAQYESDSDKPTLVGQCIIENFHVTNTPIIAQLLSMSLPTNVFELLAGKGVPFAILNAPFRYEGSTLELLKARATGVSLGITVDGEIDLTSDSADIRGTIIPAYLLNNLVGTVPVIGDILTGPEKEGIFAAQYSAKGPTEDLEIFVNPLTVLAPGILRDLFNLFSPDNAQPVE